MKKYNRKTIPMVLSALAFLLAILPMPALAAPVEFYWAAPKNLLATTTGTLLSDFAIYDSDDVKQDWLAEPSQKANSMYYDTAVSYDLAPGHYKWEGKVYIHNKTSVPASGYFEVKNDEGDPQRFFLGRARVQIGSQISPSVSRGVDEIELRDYMGNILQPYQTDNHYSEGVVGQYYLIIIRTHGKDYDETTNPDDSGQAYVYKITPGIDGYAAYSGLLFWDIGKFKDDPADWGAAAVPAVNKLKVLTRNAAIDWNKPPRAAVPTKIEVPKGADVHIYRKDGLHFTTFYEYPRKNVDTSNGGYDIHEFDLPDGTVFHCESSGGNFTREMQEFYIRSDNNESFHIKYDLGTYDKNYRDDNPKTSWDDNLYLNTDGSRFLEIKKGGHFDLFPIRAQQAQTELVGNYFTEPDYHFELIDASSGSKSYLHSISGGEAKNGSISVAPCPDPQASARGRQEYRITGLSEGMSVIKITYDAIRLRSPIGQGAASHTNSFYNKDFTGHYFDPILEQKTAVVAVNVVGSGYDSSALSTGITEDEDDTVYFDSREKSAEFTFKPSVSGGGEIKVRAHKPIHDGTGVEWGEGWKNSTKNPDGSFTVTLLDGRNIIEVKSGGVTKYHVVLARPVRINYRNVTAGKVWEPGGDFEKGDVMEAEFKGLTTPVLKLAAVYNPTYTYLEYIMNGKPVKSEMGGQFDLPEGIKLRFTIPDGDKTVLSGGRIYNVWMGMSWGYHRFIPRKGKAPMLMAGEETGHPWHATLPDLVFGKADGSGPETPDLSAPAVVPTPPGIVPSNPDVRPGQNPHAITDGELAEVISSLPPDKADALEGAVDSGEHGVTANPGAIADGLTGGDRHRVSADAGGMIPLPVFKAWVENGKTALVTIAVPLGKFDGHHLSGLAVLKLRNDNVTEILRRAASVPGISGAEYVWTDADGTELPGSTLITAGTPYYLSVAIKDNSAYDWDPSVGLVVDPMAISLAETGGGSSGGCDAGFGLLGLGLAVMATAARRRHGRR